jgi:calcineurin-like phosphoesterase family protein
MNVSDEGAVEGPAEAVAPPRALVFVHLSDLHFRDGSEPLAEREAHLRDRLLQDIPKVVALADGKLEAILLTGDLARSGQKTEYEAARGWLDELCGRLGLHETSTLMCPGNHDVDWKALDVPRRTLNESLRECPAHLLDQRIDAKLTDPDFVLAPLEHYQEFAARCACDVEKCLAWELEQPIRFGDGYALTIRGASTVINSDGDDAVGTMAVHTNQLIVKEKPGIVRMLLMHHSPPFWRRSEPGPGEHDHNVVLYGHTHTPDHQKRLPSCLEITAGAVHPEEQEEFVIPSYNVIELSIDDTTRPTERGKAHARIRVFRREFDRKANEFIEAGKDPTIDELVEVPRAAAAARASGPDTPGPDDAGEVEEGTDVDGDAEMQPPLETAGGQPDPSRRVRAAFERLGSGDRLRVLRRVGIPADEITYLPPHRQIREVARRVLANGNVEEFLDAATEIGGGA